LRRHDQGLESFAKRELDGLARQLAAEAAARAEVAQGILRELQKAVALLEKRDAQLEAAQAQAARDLREQLVAEGAELLERQRQWRDEILAALAEGLDRLRATETDRTALANLFSEMSSRLASGSPSASTVH
jgi:FtsZ-binding cell division protein ZapB